MSTRTLPDHILNKIIGYTRPRYPFLDEILYVYDMCKNFRCDGCCDKLYCPIREDNTCHNSECNGHCGKIFCDSWSDHDYDLDDYDDDRDW